MHIVQIKRIYEKPDPADGYRMLVDRVWPRGVKKDSAKLDEWNKTISPSDALRKWFNHKPERFREFERKYRRELASLQSELNRIRSIAHHSDLTLLYGAKDTTLNQAAVLKRILTEENS